MLLVTLRASCGAVYCNRSCLYVCLFVCVCLWVCYHDNSSIACIDHHQTGFVGKGSDHLHLIKFWPSHAPEKWVCGGANIFGSALLQPARSVCVASDLFCNNARQLSLSNVAYCYAVRPPVSFAIFTSTKKAMFYPMFVRLSVC